MTALHPGTLGIDFGTSNSAIAWAPAGGAAQPIALEGDASSMPTAVFYNAELNRTHFGREAVAHYLSGTEGRLMRSLKSLLGSPLLEETTLINQQAVGFQDIIATFLGELRERAARHLGHTPQRVVMGRPVHFVDGDPERDQLAEDALRGAAESVGFEEVRFQLEPIAAALDHERRLTQESTVLVVDIGGGTSDFTAVRLGPQRAQRRDRSGDVLATTGVHIGGTDFDQRLSLELVMPLLGHRHLGPEGREVPSRVFFDLSTWHLINWLYQARPVHQAQLLRSNYSDPALHARLMRVLKEQHGHHIAHAVEQAKIACSQTEQAAAVALDVLERELQAPMAPAAVQQHLQHLLQRTVACARECVQMAGLQTGQIDAIYLCGGSSALRPFQRALQTEFAGVPLVQGDLFGGVASGLCYSQG